MKIISKYFKYLLLFPLPIFLFTSCDKSQPDPVATEISGVGWAVGTMDNNLITILHTEDGGKTWNKQTELCTGFTDFMGISAVSDEVAWAVGGKANGYGVIIRTKDKGEGWCRVGKSDDIPNVVLHAIKATDVNQAWVAGENSTLMHTLDGGLTWVKPDLSAFPVTTFYSISQYGNHLWLAGISGTESVILHSADGGITWQRSGQGTINDPVKDIQAVNANVITVSGTHNVYLTADGGNTWNVAFTSPDVTVMDVCATNINNIYFVSSSEIIYHTADMGNNWTTNTVPSQGAAFNGITGMVNGSIWIVGQKPDLSSVILMTSDGGKTWTEGTTDAKSQLMQVSFVSSVK